MGRRGGGGEIQYSIFDASLFFSDWTASPRVNGSVVCIRFDSGQAWVRKRDTVGFDSGGGWGGERMGR